MQRPKAFYIQELMRYTWNLDLSSQNKHLQNQVIKTSFAAKNPQKTEITKKPPKNSHLSDLPVPCHFWAARQYKKSQEVPTKVSQGNMEIRMASFRPKMKQLGTAPENEQIPMEKKTPTILKMYFL